jgi:ATP-dependent DNA ligase
MAGVRQPVPVCFRSRSGPRSAALEGAGLALFGEGAGGFLEVLRQVQLQWRGLYRHFALERLWRRLQPLATAEMPLDVPPASGTRFGSPLVLSRVHWVRPELVAEVKYLTWTDDNLLRQVVYEGLREDKPAAEVRRASPHLPAIE